VESLRLTAFPTGDQIESAENWWQTVAGSDPERRVLDKRQGLLQSGQYREAILRMAVKSERIDWVIIPAEDAEPNEEGPPSIGPLAVRIEDAKALASAWCPHAPPLRRVAFGAILHEPAADRIAGYERLAKYLPAVELDPAGSSDFLYQINRPRASKTSQGVDINRLSKWAVVTVKLASIVIGGGRGSVQEHALASACRLELDISTTADRDQSLPPENLAHLFKEIFELGIEIADHGDVK
jgi:hypothetical protein